VRKRSQGDLSREFLIQPSLRRRSSTVATQTQRQRVRGRKGRSVGERVRGVYPEVSQALDSSMRKREAIGNVESFFVARVLKNVVRRQA
jgi:hypothetical protein